MTKKAFDEFLNSIENFYDRNQLEHFEEYVKARYISRLDFKAKCAFIKNLWKFSFYLDEEECNTYRRIAYRSLIFIINSDKNNLLEYIEREKNFFNGHIRFEKFTIEKDSNNIHMYEHCSTGLIYLLFEIPEIIKYISEDNIQELKNVAHKNINYLLLSGFLFENNKDHVRDIISNLRGLNYCIVPSLFDIMQKKALDKFNTDYNQLAIYYFFNCQNSTQYSPDWDYINWTYSGIIEKVLPSFTQVQLEDFLKQLTPFHTQSNCFTTLATQIKHIASKHNYSINYGSYTIDLTKY